MLSVLPCIVTDFEDSPELKFLEEEMEEVVLEEDGVGMKLFLASNSFAYWMNCSWFLGKTANYNSLR